MSKSHNIGKSGAATKKRSHARAGADRHLGRKVAVVVSGPGGGQTGGAERFYDGLVGALRSIGCIVDVVPTSAQEPDVDTIVDNYATASKINLKGYDFVISTKVPSYAVDHPRHVVYLVHTVRIFDDMFDERFPDATIENRVDRARVHRADFDALKNAKAIFAIGHEVADRLYRWRGLESEVLHPPMAVDGFKCESSDDFFFIPGRLHPWKRLDLAVRAIKASKLNLRLKIAGVGEHEQELRELIGSDPRVELLGRISDQQLIDLYANCRAVPFVTKREDYGYVTLEAFASSKPVVTCEDSGEPARFVVNGVNGYVVQPTVDALREALESLWRNPAMAEDMGRAGLEVVGRLDWHAVAMRLADAAFATEPTAIAPVPVTIVDMQPIDPPVGGGRLRLLGLYHSMGHSIDCTYVGTYDWPGEKYRDHYLTPSLREIDVPLSSQHHDVAKQLTDQAGGLNVIDLMFSQQAILSREYVATVIEKIRQAKVVIFSHPWVYPLVAEHIREHQTVIYDSQNVEGYLRSQLVDRANTVQMDVLKNVVNDELLLCQRADWILTCSHEDLLGFHRLYGVSPSRLRVVPNGVMAFQQKVANDQRKQEARRRLGIASDALVGIFIGTPYGPNVDAGQFIADKVAPNDLETIYVVAGGVGSVVSSASPNLRITGQISDSEKGDWLSASDFAINPMTSGSGTNIKMFDFMAAGLPILTTETGARGIDFANTEFVRLCDPTWQSFKDGAAWIRGHPNRPVLTAEARTFVEEGFAWERISHQLGSFCASRHKVSGQSRPYFSVVVPTFGRPDKLYELMQTLQRQVERDFEIIVVDQSEKRWAHADEKFGIPFNYYHSPVRGAVRARNAGAMLAQGKILAFVDDDCVPEPEWLLNARQYFQDDRVVGVEGMIYSDHLNDPDWRPVTNVGFEGIGFMTANLMCRSAVFQYLGGFDLQFDRPHFREDTDFGWRLQELGRVPYSETVRVFHPAQPRGEARESLKERTTFFRNDAKLFFKHPERYKDLFFRECQFAHNPYFISNVLEGFKNLGIPLSQIPSWIINQSNKKS